MTHDAQWTATTDDVFEHWMASKARNTQLAYTDSFDQFIAWVPDVTTPEGALRWLIARGRFGAERAIEQWRDHLLNLGKAPRTVGLRMTALQSLMKSARKLGVVDWRVQPEKPRVANTRDTRGPTPEDFRRLILYLEARRDATSNPMCAYPHRWLALVQLLGFCSLRVSEALSLDVEHVDLSRSLIRHTRKGTAKRRHDFRIPAAVCESLRRWMTVREFIRRRLELDPNSGPVFITWGPSAVEPGGRLDRRSVLTSFVRWSNTLKLPRITPHSLRHYAITRSMDLGASVRQAQRLAGHSNIQTTQVYDDARTAMDDQARTAELVAQNWDRVRKTPTDAPLAAEPIQTGRDALALLLGEDDGGES